MTKIFLPSFPILLTMTNTNALTINGTGIGSGGALTAMSAAKAGSENAANATAAVMIVLRVMGCPPVGFGIYSGILTREASQVIAPDTIGCCFLPDCDLFASPRRNIREVNDNYSR